MKLLEKVRKMTKVLQKEKLDYNALARVLGEVVGANIYIVTETGKIAGYSLNAEFECDRVINNIISKMEFHKLNTDYMNSLDEVDENFPYATVRCVLDNKKCAYPDKVSCLAPLFANGERVGTLVAGRYNETFSNDDLTLLEYAATIAGLHILTEKSAKLEDEVRAKAMVQIAFSSLSFSEWEAIVNVLAELKGDEGILITSKIADKAGITRSVVVNAMRKFESAGLIDTKSLGMKGTYIKVKNKHIFDEIKK